MIFASELPERLQFHESHSGLSRVLFEELGHHQGNEGGKGGESYLVDCCLNTFNSICTLGDFLGQLLHMAIHRVIADIVITVMRFVRTVRNSLFS